MIFPKSRALEILKKTGLLNQHIEMITLTEPRDSVSVIAFASTNLYFYFLDFCSATSLVKAQENILAPIIKIGEKSGEVGTGFLIGEKSGTLYFITANHVVVDYSEKVPIRFRGGINASGTIYRQNESLDIAVITSPKPVGYTIPPSFGLATGNLRFQQGVITIGHPYGNDWDINYRSSIKEIEIDFDTRYFYLNPDGIRPGSSGGPVLNTDRELLGMMINLNDIKATIISREILIRIVQERWQVPTNQMLGIPQENQNVVIDNGQIAYSQAIQEANYAFVNGYWENAKRAFTKANNIKPSQNLKDKIEGCDREIATTERYKNLLNQGINASDLTQALKYYRAAQKERNTTQIKDLITQAENRIAAYNIPKDTKSVSTKNNVSSPKPYVDPYAGEMIFVEGGSFVRGSESQKVTLKPFYMGKLEVTQELWEKIMNDNPSKSTTGKNYPVESVSWNDVQDFIKKLNQKSKYTYRLPTEAEWEYAAGGGSGNRTTYAGTNDEKDLYQYGNYYEPESDDKDKYEQTSPVGNYKPNQIGLYDMSGNVREWCEDRYHDSYKDAPTDGSAYISPAGSDRVIRGGSWFYSPERLRVALRYGNSPDYRSYLIGLRLARTP